MSAAHPAPARQAQGGDISFREDIRTAQRSMKILRKLCKQYGMSFQGPGAKSEVPQAKSKSAPKKKNTKKERKSIHSQLFRQGATSSSESDFDSVDDPDGLEHRTQWEDVESMMDRLRLDDRVDALEDISESLNRSSERAQRELLELDLMACRREEDDADGDDAVDVSLLHHKPEDMLAVQAVSRCVGLLPELAAWSARKAREGAGAEQKVAQVGTEAEAREVGAPWEEDSDSGGDTELAREIDGKLRKIGGKIPPGADPDLGVVLEAQRREVRKLVQEIKEREQAVEKKRLGMDYLHGKISDFPQEKDARDAVEDILKLKRVEVERLQGQAIENLQKERGHVRVPTKAEVEESGLEAERLRALAQRGKEKFESMMRPPAEAEGERPLRIEYPGADGGVSPRMISLRRGAAVTGLPGAAPQLLEVSGGLSPSAAGRGDFPEGDWQLNVAADLMKASKNVVALEEQAAQEDLRAARAGELIAGAEGALRTLEETRVAFLTQVAESAPELLDDIMPERPDTGPDRDESEEEVAAPKVYEAPESPQGDPAASQDAPHEEDKYRRLEALAKEEEWLRSELVECLELGPPSSSASPWTSERGQSKERARSKEDSEAQLPFTWRGAAPLVDDLDKLVRRVQEASRQAWREPPEFMSEMARATAKQRLAVMNHSQLQELLRSRAEGVRLSQEIVRAGAELDHARARHKPPWPATLLRPSAEGGGEVFSFNFRRGSAQEIFDPHQTAESGVGFLSATRGGSNVLALASSHRRDSRESFRPGSKGEAADGLQNMSRQTSAPDRPTPRSSVKTSSRPATSEMSPEAAELFAKVQQVQSLRMQWWSKRQGSGAVVRRAFASEGLVLDPGSSAYFQKDTPPTELCELGFFAQVHSSMTAL